MTTILIVSDPAGGHRIKLQSGEPERFKLCLDLFKAMVPRELRRCHGTSRREALIFCSAGSTAHARASARRSSGWTNGRRTERELPARSLRRHRKSRLIRTRCFTCATPRRGRW